MGLAHSPRVVTNNLLLNLDFRNPKRFTGSFGTNLVQDPTYNASTWGIFFTTLTAGIDSPDGSNTAVRMTPVVRSGTYTLTSNVATITITGHGLSGGNHYFDFTSGTGVDNFYNVTVVNANTFTIPVTASNGSGNVTLYVRTGLRINHNSVTPNGTDSYTISFWVRKVSGTTLISGQQFLCDWHDGAQKTYTNELIDGRWVYVTHTLVPTATAKTFVDILSDTFTDYVLDFWGLKVENQNSNNTPLPLKDNVGGYVFDVYRPQYSILSDSDITFERTTAPASKWGGTAFTTGTESLTSANFLYNDHTWEVWFKINDRTPEGTANEGFSGLANYRGYHSGFHYTSTTMSYFIWNGITTTGTPCTWTIGTSGTQIIQGQWYQIVVTRSGNSFTPYLNGVQTATAGSFAPAVGTGTTNVIHIGAVGNLAAGAGSFVYYARNTIANMKMYNRALSAAEVSQNFNALRGRYGI
jgi:hypothetical protein